MMLLGQYEAELVLILDDTGRYWSVFGGDGSVWCGTGWYLVVLCQYDLVLLGIKCYWVDGALIPVRVYILKKVEIWSGVTIAGRQPKKER